MNRSKLSVIAVEWNKPLYTPNPVFKYDTYTASHTLKPNNSNNIIVARLKIIDNMRLKVTALFNSIDIVLIISIVSKMN